MIIRVLILINLWEQLSHQIDVKDVIIIYLLIVILMVIMLNVIKTVEVQMCKHLIWIGIDQGYRCKYGITSIKKCAYGYCLFFEAQAIDDNKEENKNGI